jgi:hypothetical protein
MPEYRLNALRPCKLAYLDVPTKLVDFIFNVGIQTCGIKCVNERENAIG